MEYVREKAEGAIKTKLTKKSTVYQNKLLSQDQFDTLFLNFVINEMLPLRTVESPYFKAFVNGEYYSFIFIVFYLVLFSLCIHVYTTKYAREKFYF